MQLAVHQLAASLDAQIPLQLPTECCAVTSATESLTCGQKCHFLKNISADRSIERQNLPTESMSSSRWRSLMLWISLWDSLSISSWGNSTSLRGRRAKESNKRRKLGMSRVSGKTFVQLFVCVNKQEDQWNNSIATTCQLSGSVLLQTWRNCGAEPNGEMNLNEQLHA